jgi:DegV family protein with EDD domain
MKMAFVTDSGTGFNQAYWKERGIYSLPLQIEADGVSYDENEQIHHDQVIENLKKKMVMKTSLPRLGHIEDLFEQLKSEGYDAIFAVPICRGLSGALNAMESCARELDLTFYGFDCYATAVIQSECILTAKKMYEEGKSVEQILEALEKMSASCDTILLVDDLQNMKRGGRLTPMAAALGGLLKIKPILHDNIETEGRVDVLSKVRTMTKAQDFVISRMIEEKGMDETWNITIAHVDAKEGAQKYAERILERIPNAKIQIIDLVSAVGIHTGLGCLALQAFKPYTE